VATRAETATDAGDRLVRALIEQGSSEPAASSLITRFADLPELTRHKDAIRYVSDRDLRTLVDAGLLRRPQRGLYAKTTAINTDEDLIEIATLRPLATLCLRTALAHHELTDDIPATIDVAIPRGSRAPKTTAPTTWHNFDQDTFDIGRDELGLDGGTTIGLYNAERSIIDAYRLRHLEGPELATDALRRWLRRRGSQPARLMTMAAEFPAARAPLRAALEILL
jgi:hypothetical protein